MKIVIGSDHAGYKMKQYIEEFLKSMHVEVIDYGTFSEDSTDYPNYAAKVAEAVSKGEFEQGILLCGTGIGMSITANKFPGIRAALCHDVEAARLARAHNNANILIIGGRTTDEKPVAEMVKTWMTTPFEGGRHQRRVDLISQIERNLKSTS